MGKGGHETCGFRDIIPTNHLGYTERKRQICEDNDKLEFNCKNAEKMSETIA